MKKIMIAAAVVLMLSPSLFADDISSRPAVFRKYNPDGRKYEFVKNYLAGLNYLKANEELDRKVASFNDGDVQNLQRVKVYKDGVFANTMNLRIAKSHLNKYRTPDNGLMLKTADLFMKACDELVLLNDREKSLLQSYEQALAADEMDSFDQGEFMGNLNHVVRLRKESYKKILEASVLAGKVLVGEKTDRYGDLVALGVTAKERDKLLSKIDEFYAGEEYEGEMRSGQSYLQASVAAIRQVLKDYRWDTTDGT